jgi:hypothetical protein
MHRNVHLAKEEQVRQEALVGVFVYVLSIEDSSHEKNFIPDSEIVGVYNSKAAALQFASTYVTPESLLSFDDMIEEYGEDGMVVDVRKKGSIIPDNGVIMQYGDDHIGASDIVRLLICKNPITGILTPESSSSSLASDDESKDKDDDDDDGHTKKKAKRTLYD